VYEAIFYSDVDGNEPLAEHIVGLKQKSVTSKNARVNLTKIVAYIDLLEQYGNY